MKAWTVVGYGFDGALYCPQHAPKARETGCLSPAEHSDENGCCDQNCHGYGPNPVLASDEVSDDDVCDTCGERLID